MKKRKISSLYIGILTFMVLLAGCNRQMTIDDGNEALQNQKYEKAVEIFEKLLSEDKMDFDAHIGLITSYVTSDNFPKAEIALREMFITMNTIDMSTINGATGVYRNFFELGTAIDHEQKIGNWVIEVLDSKIPYAEFTFDITELTIAMAKQEEQEEVEEKEEKEEQEETAVEEEQEEVKEEEQEEVEEKELEIRFLNLHMMDLIDLYGEQYNQFEVGNMTMINYVESENYFYVDRRNSDPLRAEIVKVAVNNKKHVDEHITVGVTKVEEITQATHLYDHVVYHPTTKVLEITNGDLFYLGYVDHQNIIHTMYIEKITPAVTKSYAMESFLNRTFKEIVDTFGPYYLVSDYNTEVEVNYIGLPYSFVFSTMDKKLGDDSVVAIIRGNSDGVLHPDVVTIGQSYEMVKAYFEENFTGFSYGENIVNCYKDDKLYTLNIGANSMIYSVQIMDMLQYEQNLKITEGPDKHRYIKDYPDELLPTDESILEKLAEEIFVTYGYDAVFVVANKMVDQGLYQYTQEFYEKGGYGAGELKTGIILVYDSSSNLLNIQSFGNFEDLYSEEALSAIFDNAIDATEEGAKKVAETFFKDLHALYQK